MSTGVATAEQLSVHEADSVDKIVILLLALEEERVTGLLQHFSEEEISLIKEAADRLGPISPQQLQSVVEEFETELGSDEALSRDPKDVYQLLETASSPQEEGPADAEKLAQTWNEVVQAETDIMFECLENEHPQSAAYVLSRLDPQTASGLVLRFEPSQKSQIVRRMMALKPVDPAIAHLVGRAIVTRLSLVDDDDGSSANRQAVANIINRMDADQREDLLTQLSESLPHEVAQLKRLLFSFEDIPKLDEASRKILFDVVPSDLLVPALQGCDDNFVEMVLSTLGARARRMVEAELSSAREVPEDATKQAQVSIASSALGLSQEEKITLPSSGEAEE